MARFTRKAIIQTFREMLEKSPLDKITVTNIIERCGINRNTFYYYFRDIYDLLDSFFKEELEKVIEANANEPLQNLLKAVMEMVRENRQIVYHIFNSLNRDQLERYLFDSTNRHMYDLVKKEAEGLNVTDEDIRYVAEFYQFAFMGLFLKYLWNGMKPDVDEYIDKLSTIMEGNIRRALENCSDKNKNLSENQTEL
ncbi:TetR/AcrR family transcriptional regulator [Thermoclostridium stercorarium]|uniref:TetR/AcrR family transcriptional regulator n=1 Tax=Thermoclostridium stercorarium TaxID=1510 RepID=UPI0022493B88|nr:TetR/AcrR family transcriptional regulator [Thermoclostridium stercorarium]UZQ85267.1 TetR/AcrR family transcriptional regulator [Thermoclostridium stercorarium]